MIYPSEVEKLSAKGSLNTLEKLWVQSRLKMWGRWAYIGGGKTSSVFNKIISSEPITRKAITKILYDLQQAGISESELTDYFKEILNSRLKSKLAFCSDDEALTTDRIIGDVFSTTPYFVQIVHKRYYGRGESIRQMAIEMQNQCRDLSEMTCRRRITQWLNIAEFMLYQPMCQAFGRKACNMK